MHESSSIRHRNDDIDDCTADDHHEDVKRRRRQRRRAHGGAQVHVMTNSDIDNNTVIDSRYDYDHNSFFESMRNYIDSQNRFTQQSKPVVAPAAVVASYEDDELLITSDDDDDDDDDNMYDSNKDEDNSSEDDNENCHRSGGGHRRSNRNDGDDDDMHERLLRESQLGYSWRAACARCTVPQHMQNGRVLVIFVLNFIFLTFLWIGVAYKITSDSALEYWEHFTNWMWTFAAVYYTLSNISMLLVNRFFESVLLFGMWWIYFSNVMVIVWLVVIMKLDNPRVLTDEFSANGGPYDAGVVFTGDFVYHILPQIYALVYLLFRIPDFVDVFEMQFAPTDAVSSFAPAVRYWKTVTRVVTYLLVLTCIASPLVVLVYYNAFDMNYVYEVDTPVYLGILIIAFSIITTIIAPVVILSPLGVMSRSQHRDSWSLSPGTPSRADVDEYARDMRFTRRWRDKKREEYTNQRY